jgi:signal transduction histidine kinase
LSPSILERRLRGTVTVHVGAADEHVQLEVDDECGGLPPEVAAKTLHSALRTRFAA